LTQYYDIQPALEFLLSLKIAHFSTRLPGIIEQPPPWRTTPTDVILLEVVRWQQRHADEQMAEIAVQGWASNEGHEVSK
jgi:hypothetical protein